MDETCVVHVFVSCHVVITRQDFFICKVIPVIFITFAKVT